MSFYRYFWSVHRSWVQHIVLPTYWTNCSICRAVNPICTAVQYYWYSCTSVPILLGLVVRYWADTGTGTCIEYSCTVVHVQLYSCTTVLYYSTAVLKYRYLLLVVERYSCTAVQLYSCTAVQLYLKSETLARVAWQKLFCVSVRQICWKFLYIMSVMSVHAKQAVQSCLTWQIQHFINDIASDVIFCLRHLDRYLDVY